MIRDESPPSSDFGTRGHLPVAKVGEGIELHVVFWPKGDDREPEVDHVPPETVNLAHGLALCVVAAGLDTSWGPAIDNDRVIDHAVAQTRALLVEARAPASIKA